MTTEKTKSPNNVLDSNSCLVWLDRSYKDLLQWKRKLESYLFEPTTQRQFEIKQQLSEKMEALVRRHKELVQLARSGKTLIGKQVDLIKNYLVETKKLEDGVQEYMVMLHQNA
ncbi:hypothetical protein [Maribacter cobaltidurans]|uniref:Uncharacterized protein n=1 Tax=Maribacter cobaltidurans TaxID=1178778 RepID=A0A223VA91_9FLAO|nr:hypothetical protein [Maribacter cobaltidurans]ASV32080.1 hypothetical protein CJ263_18685 [Maribacter cobaltidurans]GGD87074.1 hypothetical protein GCM10011412_26130 [Maribacter cobaltidurans]